MYAGWFLTSENRDWVLATSMPYSYDFWLAVLSCSLPSMIWIWTAISG